MDLTNQLCTDLKPLKGNNKQYSIELMHRTKHEGDKNLFYVAGIFFCKSFPV